MEISPICKSLLDAIENYIASSSKVGYRFTLNEYLTLNKQIEALAKHLEILMNYEDKRQKEE